MKKLAHAFIPHAGNRYRPHAIQRSGLIVFALLILLMQGIYNHSETGQFRVLGYATNVDSSALLAGTNSERTSFGLSNLIIDPELNAAAQAKAEHMIANDYWSHYAPDGTSPWFFMAQAGYTYDRAGENLAFKFNSSNGVIRGWMNSPAHRANLLDDGFTEIGFGIANGESYQGDQNTVVVAMYGQPFQIVEESEAQPVQTLSNDSPTPPQPEEAADSASGVSPLTATRELDGSISVRGDTTSESSSQSLFSVISSGSAPWSLYMLSGLVFTLGAIYFIRHLQAIKQIIQHGEHYVAGHPTLEASLVYVLVWAFVFTASGVVQ